MKKLISLLLVAIIPICVVSCGKNSGGKDDPTPPTEAAQTPPQSPEPAVLPSPSPTPTEAPPESTPEATPETFTLTAANYPRVDGSTATIPLGEALAATLLGLPRENAADYALFSGTANAVERLAGNFADLIIVYEPPTSIQ